MIIPNRLPKSVTDPFVKGLARLGVTANLLTCAQMLGGLGAALVIANGYLLWGSLVMLASALLDAFDGNLARYTGTVTKFGGVLDSVADRIFDGAVLCGLGYFYLNRGLKLETMLVFGALLGSLLVPYVRATAEKAGITMLEGFLPRQVRTGVIFIALLAGALLSRGAMTGLITALMIFSFVTVVQRLDLARKRLD